MKTPHNHGIHIQWKKTDTRVRWAVEFLTRWHKTCLILDICCNHQHVQDTSSCLVLRWLNMCRHVNGTRPVVRVYAVRIAAHQRWPHFASAQYAMCSVKCCAGWVPKVKKKWFNILLFPVKPVWSFMIHRIEWTHIRGAENSKSGLLNQPTWSSEFPRISTEKGNLYS
mgnify:CR=1 FL=1